MGGCIASALTSESVVVVVVVVRSLGLSAEEQEEVSALLATR
jgi:hypothetical protein